MTDCWWRQKIDAAAAPLRWEDIAEAVERRERRHREAWKAWAEGRGSYPDPIIVSPGPTEYM